MSVRHVALLRLGGLAAGLGSLVVVFAVAGLIGTDTVREWVEPAGILAPLAFVVIAGVLGAMLVPGAALAVASGLLFGAVAGALISLPSAVLSAVLSQRFSARAGGDALDELSGPRMSALTSFARRRGFSAVVIQRLLPAVPDGPFSHAFGLAGVRTRDIALGTLVASGPRALSYALLGANATDLTGPDALAGIVLNVATGAFGLGLAWIVLRRERMRIYAVGADPSQDEAEGTAEIPHRRPYPRDHVPALGTGLRPPRGTHVDVDERPA
ncbi:MAG: TVP38/TMEM64 family protein [Patulibacter sp.]|nr:TVP38/TMEM64 family protein [Patulibacter sp.]